MPAKPLLVYDGLCGFCRIWIDYWKELTGPAVDYAPSQEIGARFAQISPEQYSQSVQLVLPDDQVHSGASAVFTTLRYADIRWPAWSYQHVPGFAPVTEAAYRFIAGHRDFFYQLTRFTFGRHVVPLTYARVEWLFLRCLALIYFFAFSSFAVQITGLLGANGILPAARFLREASSTLGVRAYWLAPGIFWIAHSDAFLRATCWAGAAIALLLLSGRFERAALACLYVLYLSLSSIGQNFLSFQWDALLLETGFLAIFLGGSKWMIFLFRCLLFRLMFLSGAVKLLSHDASWRNLSALGFHYMTQPLPTPIAWYMYQLPARFQQASTALVLTVELAVPFLIFGPRPWRRTAAVFFLALQLLIFLTGNYAFFNLLAMSLCVFLFDDAALTRLRLRERVARTPASIAAALTVLILFLSGLELWGVFDNTAPLGGIISEVAPLNIVNTYGLFAVMTTERPEIVVQGSRDGGTWLDYQFRYKPGPLDRAPVWVAPHQPRLDWQLWFAALSGYQSEPWFVNFMVRLLQGSRDVTGLLEHDPFPDAPPKYVRALVFDYSFTSRAERKQSGNWWKRRPRGIYLRAISLEDLR